MPRPIARAAKAVLLVIGLCLGQLEAAAEPSIKFDADRQRLTLADGHGNLSLRLDCHRRCIVDRIVVRGRQVSAHDDGASTGIALSGRWFTSRSKMPSPSVSVAGDTATISGIVFSIGDLRVTETWAFTVRTDRILWRIDREYLSGGPLDDTPFPMWNFADGTWTGALLGTGGVMWGRYLDRPVATYGAHTGKVVFWNHADRSCLRIEAAPTKGRSDAVRFTRQRDGALTACFSATNEELQPKHGQARFLDGADLWRQFCVRPGKISVTYTLAAGDYDAVCNRGEFRGIDGDRVRELLNTVGRYGVIDQHLVGTNGWRSGYAVFHEPWIAQIGLAVNDADYTANVSAALDHERDHAIAADGRVKSRFCYTADDAMPGTWDPTTGYYEAQWGYLLDSQPGYVICVAEQFDVTGDRAWARGHKQTCERALDYLLRRDADGNGLVEMLTKSRRDARGSDWLDVVWASHENALVNAEMYAALTLWADVEDALGDPAQASRFHRAAGKLKTTFNKPIAEGGFWNPARGWYVYWRDADQSIHGDNLVTPVNFGAIGYGLCDDAARRRTILDGIETRMRRENLFHWPLCFESFAKDEVHAINWPFPSYENGDIFLAWGELGIRAYADADPAVAVKYVKKVLDRYRADGLSFQRYLRKTQQGAGDDILANNAMTIVGLYRDIFGIQPKYNRLLLDPHMTPELQGTRLRYRLRGRDYVIEPRVDGCRVAVDDFTLNGATPFAVDVDGDRIECFAGDRPTPSLTVVRSKAAPVAIDVAAWPRDDGAGKWTLRGGGSVRCRLRHLAPEAAYWLRRDGGRPEPLRSDAAGRAEFDAQLSDRRASTFEVKRLP